MRNIFWVSILIVLLASSTFGATTSYSFLTTLGQNANAAVNGTVVYDPDLDAVFIGQYFTGLGSRSNILGWGFQGEWPDIDSTYGTSTPRYYIRERMYNNGLKMGGLKSVFGAATYLKGKLYFVSDRWGYTDLTMRPRLWCPVNSDSVTVTFPYVTANLPLYAVNGVSSTASTQVEDTWSGTQLYASTATTFTLISTTSQTDGYWVIIPGNQFLAGITGVWTNNDTTALGTNFYTGGEVNGPTRTAWCNTFIPGSPRPVYVTGSVQRFQPQTGVIELVTPHPPGQLLFVDVGQLQPGQRGVWKYSATTLAAETGFGIYGTPVMFEPCTVANIITSGGVTTGLDIGVPGIRVTDQFLVTREIGTNNTRGRLGYASYGRFTTGPWVSTSATTFKLDVQGRPYSTIYGVYTTANCVGTNFWGRRTFNGWIAVTDTAKVVVPWGPIAYPTGIFTNANKLGINFFTGLTYGIETLSVKSGSGGIGGWWNVSVDTPTIYAAISGINTTLSLGSVFVLYDGEPPDAYTPGKYNPMDTTGIINLQIPLPGPGTSVWIDFDRNYGRDVANNMVRTIAPAANTPPMHVGDTVYISMLAQGGANPYKYTGSGTTGNRAVTANPYGVTFDKDGNFFTCSLWSYWGIFAHDSAGNLIARYPVKGALSTVTRGEISCDTATGDIYWGDVCGVVWRFKKTGAGIDSYVQENEPFYLGACLGTNNTVLRGMVTSLKVITGWPFFYDGQFYGTFTQIYLTTPMDYDGPTPWTDIITIMRPDGTINTRCSYDAITATLRGIDVKLYHGFAGLTEGIMMTGMWSQTIPPPYPQVYLWSGWVPVELSRFETVIE